MLWLKLEIKFGPDVRTDGDNAIAIDHVQYMVYVTYETHIHSIFKVTYATYLIVRVQCARP